QRQQTNLQVFELGSVYIPSKLPIEDQPREQQTLGLAMTGLYPRQWGLPPREVDFFDLKGLLELVFQRLGIACQWERAIHSGFHPGRCAIIKLADTKIGVLGEIHREVAENWELTARVYVAEIDLEAVIPQARREVLVEKLPRYPLVARDLALLAPDTVPAEVILRTMEDAGDEIVKDITLFDVYQGRQIPDGYRSLAYSVRYQASDRTLTDEEIQAAEDAIMTRLEEELGITRR
ncbi:MAG: phenylalanine--tRNA ligase subunit beta, partial [Firmicutes bacterium]|nr:phenylalanine--tRNA ligase subunit beta [Bacillota bacterium]